MDGKTETTKGKGNATKASAATPARGARQTASRQREKAEAVYLFEDWALI